MNHAPSPWKADTDGAGNIIIMLDHEGEDTVFIWGKEGQGYGRVAVVYAECGGTVEDNARLIAAAPEMMEALKDIANGNANVPDQVLTFGTAALARYMWNFSQKRAHEAIAKANMD